jgi:transcriptional regulator with XRE-family HTH domain
MQSKFRKWLYDNGYSVEHFANKIGVGRSSVQNWLAGRAKPRVDLMKKVRQITNGQISKVEDIVEKK